MTAAPTNRWLTDALTLAIEFPDLTPPIPSGRTAPACRPPPPPVGMPLPPPPNAASREEEPSEEAARINLYRETYRKMLEVTGTGPNGPISPAEPKGPNGHARLAEPTAEAAGDGAPAGQKGPAGRARLAEPTAKAAGEVPQQGKTSPAELKGPDGRAPPARHAEGAGWGEGFQSSTRRSGARLSSDSECSPDELAAKLLTGAAKLAQNMMVDLKATEDKVNRFFVRLQLRKACGGPVPDNRATVSEMKQDLTQKLADMQRLADYMQAMHWGLLPRDNHPGKHGADSGSYVQQLNMKGRAAYEQFGTVLGSVEQYISRHSTENRPRDAVCPPFVSEEKGLHAQGHAGTNPAPYPSCHTLCFHRGLVNAEQG
jgi:hypothetical protein